MERDREASKTGRDFEIIKRDNEIAGEPTYVAERKSDSRLVLYIR